MSDMDQMIGVPIRVRFSDESEMAIQKMFAGEISMQEMVDIIMTDPKEPEIYIEDDEIEYDFDDDCDCIFCTMESIN